MIFPIRTETDTKKLPYFTMGLIILNLLIWVFTSRIVGPEDQARAEIRYAMFKIEYAARPVFRRKNRRIPRSVFQEHDGTHRL
jgi:hypothetical protein